MTRGGRSRNANSMSTAPRAGLVAVSELTVVIAVLIGLFWLGSQLVTALAETSDAATAASGCSTRGVYRMSLAESGQRMWVFRPSEGAVQIDTPTGETVRALALAGLDISAMAHARLNMTSLVCTSDGTLILFREGQEAHLVELKLDREMIVDAAVSDRGEIAACVTTGGNVFGTRTTSGSVETFEMHVGGTLPVMRIGVSHTGSQLLVAKIDGTVSFYDAATLELTRTLSPLEEYAGIEHVAFAWSEDEQSLAVASATGLIHLIDLGSGTCVRTIRLNIPQTASRMTALAISSDRHVAVSANTFFDILMLDMNTGRETGRLEGHTGIVRSIEFSPDEQRLYSGSYDGSVREWRPDRLQFVRIVD